MKSSLEFAGSSLSRWCVVLSIVLFAPVALAHEIGTTRVDVRFQPGIGYSIEIVTDATALVEKLDAASGVGTAADSLQSRLGALDETFRRRVKVIFDGSEVRPAIAYVVSSGADQASATATIRLTGAIPRGAHEFRWMYGWTFASYAMTVSQVSSAKPVAEWLEGGQMSRPMAVGAASAPPNRLAVAGRYLALGFTHIVPNGLDHMLFVLGIYLLSGRARSLFWQVSAFTLAHSMTLGLSMYGVIAVPSRIVEPLIALSIAYVAIENILLSELRAWRVGLVFAFGLLHGMGFAGALEGLRLSPPEFFTALLSFNVGVEAGQFAVLGAAFILVGWHCGGRPWYRRHVVVPASLLIACAGLYWTALRLAL